MSEDYIIYQKMQFQRSPNKTPILRSSYGNQGSLFFSPMNRMVALDRVEVIPHHIRAQQHKIEGIDPMLKKRESNQVEQRKVTEKMPLDVQGQLQKNRRIENEKYVQEKLFQEKNKSHPFHVIKGSEEEYTQFRCSFNTNVRKQQNPSLRNTTHINNYLKKFNFPLEINKKGAEERSPQVNSYNAIKVENTNSSFKMPPPHPYPPSGNISYPTTNNNAFRSSRQYKQLQQPPQEIKEQVQSPPKTPIFPNNFNIVRPNEPKFSCNQKKIEILPTQPPIAQMSNQDAIDKKASMITIESKLSIPTAGSGSLVTASSVSTLNNEDKFETHDGKDSHNFAETYNLTTSFTPNKCTEEEDKRLIASLSSKHFSSQIKVPKSLSEILENKNQENKLGKKRVNEKFQIGPVLGKGRFGEVFLCRHIETGFILAMKRMSKSKVKEYKMIDQLIKEIKLHNSFDHPHITRFYGFFEDGNDICILMEYLNGGTLFDSLNKLGSLNIKDGVQYLRHVIEAVDYMHARSIAHRDIKPENIVLSSNGVAKLCDFGWAALIQSGRMTHCGTFEYVSPEIFEHKVYDLSVDIWGIGMLAYELLVGKMPFEGQKKEVINKIVNINQQQIPYPDQFPPEAKQFIEKLLQKDPSNRPKSNELLGFSLFKLHPSRKDRRGV